MRSDTLFWPKDGDNIKDSSDCGSGYVVGWREFDEARESRTTICAAVIPDASSAAGSSSAGRGYGLDQVNDAIDELSAKYVCPNDHGGRGDLKSDGQMEHEMCSCCTCTCIMSLQVVGRWQNKGEKRRTSTRGSPKRGANREELELPVITSLSSGGVWFQDGGFAVSNESSNTFRELIWYHRHGRAALGHYKLDGDTPSTLFRQILQRLNESQNITRELIDALEGRGAPATSDRTDGDDSEKDGLSMPSNYCGAFISRFWEKARLRSLTAIHLAWHRTDTLEYDSMQLLLGTMLFTICLFLFTTLLVYYAFFTTVALSVAACGVLVWFLHTLILQLPLAECLVRILYPNRFPRTVYFSHSGETADGIHTSTLVSVPYPIGKVFSAAYGPPFSRFFSQLPSFVGELVAGRPVTFIEACIDSTRQK